MTVSFAAPIEKDIHRVESLIRSQAAGYHPDLGHALDLILNSGGKRIRPSLTLLVGRMLGISGRHLLSLAAAIELLHTATLVHDDLIDHSLLRRGMPTINSQWSTGATVLSGDFLFACAAKLASETDSIPVMKLFAKTLIVIVNGEITQLFSTHCQINREEYFQRIYAKTASLFETAAWSAALLKPLDDQQAESIRRFGYEIGMAFQIMDDILDFTGDQSSMGKPVGSDLRQGLVTLPCLCYIETNPQDPDVQYLLAGNCPGADIHVERLIDSIRFSDAVKIAHQEAQHYIKRGIDHLHKQPYSSERQSLEDLANYIVQRQV